MLDKLSRCHAYSFNLTKETDNLEKAIAAMLDKGIRTVNIMADGARQVGTVEMGEAILTEVRLFRCKGQPCLLRSLFKAGYQLMTLSLGVSLFTFPQVDATSVPPDLRRRLRQS